MSKRNKVVDFLDSSNKSALAKALGISRPTLDRYRRDPEEMPLKVLRRAASIKGYKVDIIPSKETYTL